MPPCGEPNPFPPWVNPIGPEVLVDLLFQHSHSAEPSEPLEDPVLQQVEEHYNLKMPSMWAEQAQRWSPEFRLTILLEVAVIKRNCQPLLDLGADPDVVVQAVFALRSDPFWRYALTVLRSVSPDLWVKTSVEIRKLAYMSHELEKWTSSPIFPELPPDTQACIRRARTDAAAQLEKLSIPLRELRQRAEADDPLLRLLERSQSTGRGRGRPSQHLATLFMVLLSDHLRVQTKHPHYREVGQAAEKLFPGCFTKRIRTNPTNLWHVVQDRCKKFKKDLGDHLRVLQAIILA
jgi:hypothetical protein